MKTTHKTHAGFSLVEVVIALGVAAVGLIPIFGMLPIGIDNTHTANVQTGAMNLITSIAADIRATPPATGISPQFSINTTGTSGQTLYFNEAGVSSTSLSQLTFPRYKALIQAVPQLSGSNATVIDRITISWPPQASATTALGSVVVVVSLPIN
jgi:uncharacterized protein (TIGR02598 family)